MRMSWIFENVTSLFLFFLSLFLTNVIFGLIRRQKNPALGLFYFRMAAISQGTFSKIRLNEPPANYLGMRYQTTLDTRVRSGLGGLSTYLISLGCRLHNAVVFKYFGKFRL